MRWAGYVTRMGNKRDAFRVLVGKSKRKKLLGRQGSRFENNV